QSNENRPSGCDLNLSAWCGSGFQRDFRARHAQANSVIEQSSRRLPLAKSLQDDSSSNEQRVEIRDIIPAFHSCAVAELQILPPALSNVRLIMQFFLSAAHGVFGQI